MAPPCLAQKERVQRFATPTDRSVLPSSIYIQDKDHQDPNSISILEQYFFSRRWFSINERETASFCRLAEVELDIRFKQLNNFKYFEITKAPFYLPVKYEACMMKGVFAVVSKFYLF